LDQFKFTQTERHSNKSYWKICVDKAVANIEDFKNNSNLTTIKEDGRKRGRFVFVITDFERNRNGSEVYLKIFFYQSPQVLIFY